MWHNKADTIARVDAEYTALDAVVRRLGTAGLEGDVPGFGARARIRRERWKRKDALAHIVEWKRQALRALRKEPSDPKLRGLVIAEKNRALYRRWHSRPARDVVAYHRQVHRDVMTAMRALPDEYFRKRFSPQWPNDLVGHSAEHRRRHLETPDVKT
ncbi:MAG TPA: maleylpyruvate isomerase N-terminal domain-containing protein [Candidatus Limnocylindrales bacterium]|nr:maleylpyruvate isomerase N-terminal domain-containing protein [Candidatus Limnocylindrales bacterium]